MNLRLSKSIEYLVQKFNPLSRRTCLVKLLYLADRNYFNQHGKRYTEAVYYRYNHGPFATEIARAVVDMDGLEIVEERSVADVDKAAYYLYYPGHFSRLNEVVLGLNFERILDRTGQEWASQSYHKLEQYVYELPEFHNANFGDVLLA